MGNSKVSLFVIVLMFKKFVWELNRRVLVGKC